MTPARPPGSFAGRRRRRCPPAGGNDPTTPHASWRGCAVTKPSGSPARPSPPTAAGPPADRADYPTAELGRASDGWPVAATPCDSCRPRRLRTTFAPMAPGPPPGTNLCWPRAFGRPRRCATRYARCPRGPRPRYSPRRSSRLTGCASNQASSAPRPSAAPSPPVVKDGHLTLSPLSLRCGILGVTGTHSEAPPEGEFCALRLRVANPDPAFHTFVAARQRLAGVEPPRDAPSGFAMAVRRQHDQVELGGQNVLEVELWYDVPKGAPVSGVRLSGDSDPEGFQSDQTVAHAPDGVLVPLTPAR